MIHLPLQLGGGEAGVERNQRRAQPSQGVYQADIQGGVRQQGGHKVAGADAVLVQMGGEMGDGRIQFPIRPPLLAKN